MEQATSHSRSLRLGHIQSISFFVDIALDFEAFEIEPNGEFHLCTEIIRELIKNGKYISTTYWH